MKRLFFTNLLLAIACSFTQAQTYKFDFTPDKKVKEGYTKVTSETLFTEELGFGYDLQPAWDGKSNRPFFFSVSVPDGNYKVTITFGSKHSAGITTVRAESRRLFIEHLPTGKGELITRSFTVNKRNRKINEREKVKIKAREKHKLNWDDKLTFELNGDAPRLASLVIEKADKVPTIFLCGNSTVVDYDNEPWAAWGQMFPRWFTDEVAIANYAESGESANTFIGAGRLKKALTQMKKGDYLFMEFGHNDQKQRGPGKGAFYSFLYNLKIYIDEARSRGAQPVLITPTQRRRFDGQGKIVDTHLDYPEAIRWLAVRENVPLIDLNELSRILYEAMGEEESIHAFVHYPANTYTGQTKELKDNSHSNTFGAYELAKCIIEGMKKAGLDAVKYLRRDYQRFNPAHPDKFADFQWNLCPFTEIEKPDGN